MSWVETYGKPSDIEEPRDRIVKAAADLLIAEGHSILAAGLSPERVGRYAEWSRRNIYNHFPTKTELLEELFRRSLAVDRSNVTDDIVNSMVEHSLSESRGDIVKVLRDIANANWAQAKDDRVIILQMLAWSVGQADDGVRNDLRDLYGSLDRRLSVGFERLFTEWEREFIPPLDAKRVATVLTALTEGLRIRASVDPDAVDDGMLSWVVLSLFPGLSQPRTDPARRIEDNVQDIAAEESLRYRERDQPSAVANARESVHRALHEQLRLRGFRHMSMDHLAAAAGISARTITRRYGELDDIICAQLEEFLPTLEDELLMDLEQDSLGHTDRIRRHLIRVAALASRETELIRATFSMMMARPPGATPDVMAPVDVLFLRLTKLMQVAIDGRNDDQLPSRSATVAMQAILVRAVTYYQDDSPADLADSVMGLV